MAIFITGDTHGSLSHGCFSVDGFMGRLNTESFPEQKDLSKEDYVIICGDFGGLWDFNQKKFTESTHEKYALDWLESKPFTTLFIPGNHENYDRLTGCKDEKLLGCWLYKKMPEEEKNKLRKGYPQKEWNGGKVRVIRPSVLMLERGYVFEINGKSIFSFGGARSHDIRDGILDPSDYPNENAFKNAYRNKDGCMFRVKGISWWEAEMPTKEEMEMGRKNIVDFLKSHDKINIILSHDAPASDKIFLGYESDELNCYLESIRDLTDYDKWFYGHLHENRRLFSNHYLLYEQILRVE